MSYLTLLLVGLFLPLFPLSMPFNLIYARVHNPVVRGIILLAWPQIGLAIIFAFNILVPTWLLIWALFTSLLYAVRALALRELGLWTSFVSTSAWALLWIVLSNGTNMHQLQLVSLVLSVPLMLMSFLVADLERRFGAAYLGLYRGLAQCIPRYTVMLVVVVLAIIATPLFPSFFVMLSLIIKGFPATPAIAVGIGVVWLMWSWAGARLLQGLITGTQRTMVTDLSQANMWLYITVLIGLMFIGMYWSGEIV